jgi:hypothetical protein
MTAQFGNAQLTTAGTRRTIRPTGQGPLMTAGATGPTDFGAYWAQPVGVSREQP